MDFSEIDQSDLSFCWKTGPDRLINENINDAGK